MWRLTRTDDPEVLKAALVELINRELAKDNVVLWLVSGGSCIAPTADVSKALALSKNLHIGQVDERYGPVGHPSSNWQQLLEAGFEADKFSCHPLLGGQNIEETTNSYNNWLRKNLSTVDTTIGLFGIGTDGHTAGILPGSTAVDEKEAYVCYYQGPDYQRITITPAAIPKIKHGFVWATGGAKKDVIASLLKNELAPALQPAQLLKQVANLNIFSDHSD